MRILPREVDPMVYSMLHEDPGKVTFDDVGGLDDEIRILREVNIYNLRRVIKCNYLYKRP